MSTGSSDSGIHEKETDSRSEKDHKHSPTGGSPEQGTLTLTSPISCFLCSELFSDCNALQAHLISHTKMDTNKGIMDTAKGTMDKTNGTVDNVQGVIDTTKGTIETTKGTMGKTKGTMYTTKSLVDTIKGTVDTTKDSGSTPSGCSGDVGPTNVRINTTAGKMHNTKGSVDITKGTMGSASGTVEPIQGTINITRGKVDTTKGTGNTTKGIIHITDRFSDNRSNNKRGKKVQKVKLNQCGICKICCISRTSLEAHIKRKHKLAYQKFGINSIAKKVIRFKCEICNLAFAHSSSVVRHRHKCKIRCHARENILATPNLRRILPKPMNPEGFRNGKFSEDRSGQNVVKSKMHSVPEVTCSPAPTTSPNPPENLVIKLTSPNPSETIGSQITCPNPPEKLVNKITCGVCSKSFMDTPNARRHITICHRNILKKHVKNTEKPKTKPTQEKLNATKTERYQCNVCGEHFAHTKSLARHVQKRHWMCLETPVFKCSVCSFQTAILPKLKKHIRDHSKNPTPGGIQFQCEACFRLFALANTARKHVREFHCDNDTYMYKLVSKVEDGKKDMKKFYHCRICPSSMADPEKLHKHVCKWHPGYKNADVYKCGKCGQVASDSASLKAHVQSHTALYRCSICSTYLIDYNSAKTHVTLYHPWARANQWDTSLFITKVKDFNAQEKTVSSESKEPQVEGEPIRKQRPQGFHRCDVCMLAFRECSDLSKHMESCHPETCVQGSHMGTKSRAERQGKDNDSEQCVFQNACPNRLLEGEVQSKQVTVNLVQSSIPEDAMWIPEHTALSYRAQAKRGDAGMEMVNSLSSECKRDTQLEDIEAESTDSLPLMPKHPVVGIEQEKTLNAGMGDISSLSHAFRTDTCMVKNEDTEGASKAYSQWTCEYPLVELQSQERTLDVQVGEFGSLSHACQAGVVKKEDLGTVSTDSSQWRPEHSSVEFKEALDTGMRESVSLSESCPAVVVKNENEAESTEQSCAFVQDTSQDSSSPVTSLGPIQTIATQGSDMYLNHDASTSLSWPVVKSEAIDVKREPPY